MSPFVFRPKRPNRKRPTAGTGSDDYAFYCQGGYSGSGTVRMTDGTLSSVQAALDAAATDGDIVCVPGGSFDWGTTALNLQKNVLVIGAGISQTTISSSGTNQFFIYMDGAGEGHWRVSGMKLTGPVTGNVFNITSSAYNGVISDRWRIDHIDLDFQTGQRNGFHIAGVNYGLIDHVTGLWAAGKVLVQASGLSVECTGAFNGTDWAGSGPNGNLQNIQGWDIGTDKFVFYEDNDITHLHPSGSNTHLYDSEGGGGKAVIRYSRDVGSTTTIYRHWTRDCELIGGVLEVYNNTIIGDDVYGAPASQNLVMQIEGGTGVFYNNSLQNYAYGGNQPYMQMAVRITATGSSDRGTTSYGACDGTRNWDGNAGDGAAPGWPCVGQVGRLPGRSWAQLTAGSIKEQTAPIYLWNNGVEAGCATGGSCTDTFAVSPSPAAYVTSTAHAVNGEKDYVNSGTPMPGYSALTYPHPLQSTPWNP